MAITTRLGKGSELTYQEMDDNLGQIPNGADSSITDDNTGNVSIASGVVNVNGILTANDNVQIDAGSGSTPTIKFTSNAQTGRYSQVKVDTNRDIVLTAGVGSVNEYPKIKMFTGTPSGEQERICIDGDGLKFNGDTAAANALDDYEEGTWTPVCSGITPTTATGTYVKIGRTCYVGIFINIGSQSSSANAQISGFPFSVAVDNDARAGLTVSYSSYTTPLTYLLDTNTAYGHLRAYGGNIQIWSALSGQVFHIGGVYQTT